MLAIFFSYTVQNEHNILYLQGTWKVLLINNLNITSPGAEVSGNENLFTVFFKEELLCRWNLLSN